LLGAELEVALSNLLVALSLVAIYSLVPRKRYHPLEEVQVYCPDVALLTITETVESKALPLIKIDMHAQLQRLVHETGCLT